MARIHREVCKKDLHHPVNYNGVITYLEPDILECEVKWALQSITMNKASGVGGIPVELFQILNDDAVKVLHSNASKFGKLSSGHRTGKGQFSFQSLRKTMPKNAPIPKKDNAKECSNYHTIALISQASKVMLKILQARLQQL